LVISNWGSTALDGITVNSATIGALCTQEA
jgi:hypothetical protein